MHSFPNIAGIPRWITSNWQGSKFGLAGGNLLRPQSQKKYIRAQLPLTATLSKMRDIDSNWRDFSLRDFWHSKTNKNINVIASLFVEEKHIVLICLGPAEQIDWLLDSTELIYPLKLMAVGFEPHSRHAQYMMMNIDKNREWTSLWRISSLRTESYQIISAASRRDRVQPSIIQAWTFTTVV